MDSQHKDRPRAEIMEMANGVIARAAGRAQVFFKFTCPACGERLTLEKPNTLYEDGECGKCGVTAPIEKAGYMILLRMPAKVGPGTTSDKLDGDVDGPDTISK